MNQALIIGDTGGIGQEVSVSLKRAGWAVTGFSRSNGDFDLLKPQSLDDCLEAVSQTFDFIFMATGQLAPEGKRPEKTVRSIDPDHMQALHTVNAIGPAVLCKHAARLLAQDRPAFFGILSARVGSIADNQMGGWISYRSSKAALNQIVKTTAIELKFKRPKAVCVALHPGTVETQFTEAFHGTRKMKTAAGAAEDLIAVLRSLTPEQSGQFFDSEGLPVPW